MHTVYSYFILKQSQLYISARFFSVGLEDFSLEVFNFSSIRVTVNEDERGELLPHEVFLFIFPKVFNSKLINKI